jgi:hypothetical protein
MFSATSILGNHDGWLSRLKPVNQYRLLFRGLSATFRGGRRNGQCAFELTARFRRCECERQAKGSAAEQRSSRRGAERARG